MAKKKTFSIISLGCFRNTYDSELIARHYREKGYRAQNDVEGADRLIINTCGFIDDAKKESLEVLNRALELKRCGRVGEVIVCGCLVKRYAAELADNFPGVFEWHSVMPLPLTYEPRLKLTSPWIDFLKIGEGCSHHCSYCVIPFIKGPLLSRPLEAILKEVRALDASGVRELNVIGQDVTAWGQDRYRSKDLALLLKKIAGQCRNIRWIRVLYTHPANFSDRLLKVYADEPRLCKYIDLPLQHINDRILRSMNRGITRKQILRLIEKIRKIVPQGVIRTSLIAGFPTESEKEFRELLSFVRQAEFDRAGVFMYSREEKTAAAGMSPQVHYQTKRRRYNELMRLQQQISKKANQRFIGRDIEVLIEESGKDTAIARSQYHCHDVDGVVFLRRSGLKAGTFYRARITDAYEYDLVGC